MNKIVGRLVDRAPARSSGQDAPTLKELHERLVAEMDLTATRTVDPEILMRDLRRGAEELCRTRAPLLNRGDREKLVNDLVFETIGLGPLEPLMRDPTVSDILINGPETVYVERRGVLERTKVSFHGIDHLLGVIQRLVAKAGRRIDESSPMVDVCLPDGSRVNAVIRPLALEGALVSIRRFAEKPFEANDLLARDVATPEMIDYLSACLQAKLNFMVSGGTGSGKTTLLNVLSSFIPETDRIVTIEDAAELRLQQPHVARMETRPPNLEGNGEITARDLVRNALRMRPDRIIIGECRGPEAFDMLQAMSTGHDGSLTTIHANDCRDSIGRLEMLVGMAVPELPMWFIHRAIANAIQVVVQVARLPGGARKIVKISEITGHEGTSVTMHDLFEFVPTGLDQDGCVEGHFQATGMRPHYAARIANAGVKLAWSDFDRKEMNVDRADRIVHRGRSK